MMEKQAGLKNDGIFFGWHRQEKYKPITPFYQALG